MSITGQTGQQEGTDVTTVVLVADDNPRYRAGIVRAIGRRPGIARVLEAGDGAEALDLIRQVRPAAALVDARMPILDGPGVARAVHEDPDLRSIRVVVMSAADDADTREAALGAGAAAFVDKTVPRAEICAVLLGDLR